MTPEEVQLYRNLRLSLLPIAPRSKKPLIDWTPYQSRRASDDEVERWFHNGDNNVGIVCGGVSGNLYVIDIDDPALLNEAPIAAIADKTVLVRTGRGLHLYVKSLVPAPITHRPSYHLDLIGDGGFVVAPPSTHPSGCKYEFASDIRTIYEVEDVNEIIRALDEKFGYHSNGVLLDKPLGDAGIVEGERNTRLFATASIDREQGVPLDVAVIRAQDLNLKSCKPPLPATEVYGLVKSAYSKAYFQRSAQKILNSESKAGKGNWKRPQDKDSSLIELAGGKPIFVEKIAPKVPPPRPYGTVSELFDRIRRYFSTYVYLKENYEYLIIVCWIVLTWVLELSPVAPYISVFAPKGHGKTRLVEALFRVVRRPLPAGFATPAGVRRALDGSEASLLLDEAEMYINPWSKEKSPANREMMAILNAGYRRDVPAIMVNPNTLEPELLKVFGCKCILSREDIFDTVQDRAIEFILPKAPRAMPDIFSPEAEAEAEEIRGQLAQYRIDMLAKGERLTSTYAADEESRLREIIEPLYAIAPQEYRQAFDEVLTRERAVRLQRLQDTREYRVLDTLNKVIPNFGTEATFIPIDAITTEYNERYPKPNGETKGPTLGRILTRLKFKSERPYNQTTKKTERAITLDWELLANLNREYGFTEVNLGQFGQFGQDNGEHPPTPSKEKTQRETGVRSILPTEPSEPSENPSGHTRSNVPKPDFAKAAEATAKLTTYTPPTQTKPLEPEKVAPSI